MGWPRHVTWPRLYHLPFFFFLFREISINQQPSTEPWFSPSYTVAILSFSNQALEVQHALDPLPWPVFDTKLTFAQVYRPQNNAEIKELSKKAIESMVTRKACIIQWIDRTLRDSIEESSHTIPVGFCEGYPVP